jgi:hypothetical protein
MHPTIAHKLLCSPLRSATLALLIVCAVAGCTENNGGSALEELDSSDSSSGSDTSGSSSGSDTNTDADVSCDALLDARSCNGTTGCSWFYTNCGGPDAGECFSNKEAPPPIQKCVLPPCEYRAQNPTDCTINGDCRWLTPGCTTEDQTPVAQGCYPLESCDGSTCSPGQACLRVVYDPCAGSNCDACGAETQVCMQAPPPPPSECLLRSQLECSVDGNCRWLEPGSCGDIHAGLLAFSAGCYPTIECNAAESCPENTDCREVSADPCPGGDCDACSRQAFLCLPDITPVRGDCAPFETEETCAAAGSACEWLTPGCGPVPTPEGCYPSDTHCTTSADCAENQACISFTHNPCRLEPCAACGSDLSFCATY